VIDTDVAKVTEAEAIEEGRRVKAFLEDPAVKKVLVSLEKRYFAAFKSAATPEEREALHARVIALDDLFHSCLGTVNNGTVAQRARDQRAVAEERDTSQRNRRGR
jgi:hypothetical protein